MEHLSTHPADHGHPECRKCGECRCGGRDSAKREPAEEKALTAFEPALKSTGPVAAHAL